jgi:hypothetical protein
MYNFYIACGCIFCDTCTTHRSIVPLLDIKTPERVCDNCYHRLQSQTLSSVFQNNNLFTQPTHLNEYETSPVDNATSNVPSGE